MTSTGLMPHYKEDDRPKKFGWAPGEYTGYCRRCEEHFIGDKRAWMCADCAYSEEYAREAEINKLKNRIEFLENLIKNMAATALNVTPDGL